MSPIVKIMFGSFLLVVGLVAVITAARLIASRRPYHDTSKILGGLTTDGTGRLDFYVLRDGVMYPHTPEGRARDGVLIFITPAPNPTGIEFGTELVFRKDGKLIEGPIP